MSGDGTFYATADPLKMIQMVQNLLRYHPYEGALFVCKDLHRSLKNDLTLRGFKDLLAHAKELPVTLVILAPVYELPVDLEPFAARIVAGYPDEREIAEEIDAMLLELARGRQQPAAALSPEVCGRLVMALQGLTYNQIRQVLAQAVVDDKCLDLDDLETNEAYKKKVFDQDGILSSYPALFPEQIAGFARLRDWLARAAREFSRPPGVVACASGAPAPGGAGLRKEHGGKGNRPCA